MIPYKIAPWLKDPNAVYIIGYSDGKKQFLEWNGKDWVRVPEAEQEAMRKVEREWLEKLFADVFNRGWDEERR